MAWMSLNHVEVPRKITVNFFPYLYNTLNLQAQFLVDQDSDIGKIMYHKNADGKSV